MSGKSPILEPDVQETSGAAVADGRSRATDRPATALTILISLRCVRTRNLPEG